MWYVCERAEVSARWLLMGYNERTMAIICNNIWCQHFISWMCRISCNINDANIPDIWRQRGYRPMYRFTYIVARQQYFMQELFLMKEIIYYLLLCKSSSVYIWLLSLYEIDKEKLNRYTEYLNIYHYLWLQFLTYWYYT